MVSPLDRGFVKAAPSAVTQLFQFGGIFGCLLVETYFLCPQTAKFSNSAAFHIFGSLSFSFSKDIHGGESKVRITSLAANMVFLLDRDFL